MTKDSRKRIITFAILISAGLTSVVQTGCNRLDVKQSLQDESYEVVDQAGEEVAFPEQYEGKVMLVGYVYTHCPDICPLITYNMRDVQGALSDEDDFMLVSISFDPNRDTPEILYQYAQNYRLNQENWRFLTGNSEIINEVLDKLEIKTLKTPTEFTESGTPQYFIDHSDKVTLIDRDGNVRNHYLASGMDQEKIVTDIHKLLKERP